MSFPRQKKQRKCKSCGCNDFIRDTTSPSSDLSCKNCGLVLEENPIVSEVTFGESSNGAATVHGSFISLDSSGRHGGFGARSMSALESRELTLATAKRRIKALALSLKVPDYVSDAAYQWFKLALTNNFVKGRRSQNVIAACLYVACRKEKTRHMLIDFSSKLQISVFKVGTTFLKLVKALHITSLPLADPSIFIQHFADQLDFGDKTLKVVKDAVKIASRMSKDWIHEGRRPAGIAGACVLLAARMNNFRRTHTEIVAICHVGEDTIQRRLAEFKKTNASKLSISDFRKKHKEIEGSSDPPSFQKNRKLEKKLKSSPALKEDELRSDTLLGMVLNDSAITENEINSQIQRIIKQSQQKLNETSTSANDSEEINDNNSDDDSDNFNYSTKARTIKLDYNILPKTEDILKKVSSKVDTFSDIDDDELDDFILDEDDSKKKEEIWVNINQEYLIDEQKKKLKRESDEISGHGQPKKRVKRKSGASKFENEFSKKENADSASAAKSILQTKTLSKKINYNVIDNLFAK
ncbi:transcription factor TFIIIB subunit BRF1 [Ascoidea rubescens DSM 1968]|uniref:B-related factor 1 n=1 Tax=Ascoidea rubescens DSM 1968 TaxID=1344418 RepID=A0A1D2VB78_9ASCO|nr:TFIIB-domain-containing protein [Ascoidea rubescens DSM 1968]ODV58860.1 TFIIB-domain-containing protein [Ascoidea rubescens DSM 1968]